MFFYIHFVHLIWFVKWMVSSVTLNGSILTRMPIPSSAAYLDTETESTHGDRFRLPVSSHGRTPNGAIRSLWMTDPSPSVAAILSIYAFVVFMSQNPKRNSGPLPREHQSPKLYTVLGSQCVGIVHRKPS